MSQETRKCSIATQKFAQNKNFMYTVESKHLKLSDNHKSTRNKKNESLPKGRISEHIDGVGNDLKRQLRSSVKIYN